MTVRKRGLGRGLDALLPARSSAQAALAETSVVSLPIDSLSPNRLQPRSSFEESGLEELAESIRAQGIIQPLVVTPQADGRFTIVAGERRWRAARRAQLAEVPVVVRELETDRELLEVALVENLQRADLNAIEEAEAFKSLREGFSLSQEEIARRVGKSRSAVTNTLRLLRLPQEVQDLLRDGRLTAGQARPLLGFKSPAQQVEVARRAAAQHLTARQLEALVTEPERLRRKKKPTRSDVHAAAAAERLTRALQTKVEIRRRKTGGFLQIHFHSEEELMRLYDRLLAGGNER